jgi:hypothetical protein
VKAESSPGSWAKRLLRIGVWAVVVVMVAVGGRCLYAWRDRNPGYRLVLDIDGTAAAALPQPLRVGFAKARINPDLSDPRRPVWLAGFSQHRAATGIHDDLWAIGCVLDDGHTRVGLVALDAIGLFHDDVLAVRRMLSPDLKLDYTVVCSTHNHSTPDLMGLWGPNPLRAGVNPRYRQQVIRTVAVVLKDAVAALEPAAVAFHEIPVQTAGLVADTRKPEVFDPEIRLMHFVNPTNRSTLGTIINWANHPETVWSRNTQITADFCGYLRQALEQGVTLDGRQLVTGLGGTHLFVNGALGGLLTTSPSVTVHDPFLNQDFKAPSHDKARAVGHQLLAHILPVLTNATTSFTNKVALGVRARTIEVPLDNFGFLLAPVFGVIDRGFVRWKTVRTEVALITIGEASLACIPGEIYPELVNGGIERAPGGDFDVDPVEVPPLRQMMPGRVKFVLGLANDEIGYIIPKSEWDRKPPYLYGASRPVYGEVNSVGPEAAGCIHAAFKSLCSLATRNLASQR